MRKTPQQFKRENIQQIFDKVLKDKKTKLEPISISASESLDDDFTTTEFSFEEQGRKEKIVTLETTGKGFVDCLFIGLHSHYVKKFPSLDKLKVVDIVVNPIMKNNRGLGSEARATVLFRVEVEGYGIAEFQHQSRSLIYSSLVSALKTFQFYINCDRTFHKLQDFLKDAESRNRGDVAQSYISDLSLLAEVNSYEKRKD
jgi:hypothetical protein